MREILPTSPRQFVVQAAKYHQILKQAHRSSAWHDSCAPGQPFCLAGISIVYGVEHEFYAAGDTQLFKNSEKILFDRVLAEVEFAGDLPVPKPSATRATTCSSRGVSRMSPFELSTRKDGTSEMGSRM